MVDEATFRRRLAAWSARRGTLLAAAEGGSDRSTDAPDAGLLSARDAREARIARLVAELDGERLETPLGTVVRVERPSRPLPLERSLLARLPGFPPPETPLVCLDTETTGLETAAGTLVFLVGLGWWEGSAFRQVGLLLPDEADEPALLETLAGHVPAGARLVTYNGRSFDWPLLVARYRLRRRPPPGPVGHLDLLPIARRWFRHRLPDARLRSVERFVLGVERVDDIEGWEVPGCYRRFLVAGRAAELGRVVDHNERDVWSLARLLVLLAERYADPSQLDSGAAVPVGDLAALARSFRRAGRLGDALACLDAATRLAGSRRVDGSAPRFADGSAPRFAVGPVPRFTVRGLPPGPRNDGGHDRTGPAEATVAAERARLLARLGETEAALAAWSVAARAGGLGAARAWIEIAKLHEWRRRDLPAALGAVGEAWRHVERLRLLGRPAPELEADLAARIARLRRKRARTDPSRGQRAVPPDPIGSAERRDEPEPARLLSSKHAERDRLGLPRRSPRTGPGGEDGDHAGARVPASFSVP